MSLPGKAEKGYLEVVKCGSGFSLHGRKQHADELKLLFQQHGIPCEKQEDAEQGKAVLLFAADVDLAKVKQVLEAYKTATGS